MSLPKKLILRILAYVVIMSYMALDLLVYKGPLSRMVSGTQIDPEKQIAEAKAAGIVARAYYQPIYRAQVEERMREHLWRRGKKEVGDSERKLLREAILAELIDELLIKIQIKVSGANDYPVFDQEKKEAVARFNARFANRESRDDFMKKQGWISGEKELEMRLAARLQREKYLVNQLALYNQENAAESPEEWFEHHKKSFQNSDGTMPAFSEVQGAIHEALEARQREKGIAHFRKILRAKAEGKIEIFRDVLHAEEVE